MTKDRAKAVETGRKLSSQELDAVSGGACDAGLLNPQPLPPRMGTGLHFLNPQPLPPG